MKNQKNVAAIVLSLAWGGFGCSDDGTGDVQSNQGAGPGEVDMGIEDIDTGGSTGPQAGLTSGPREGGAVDLSRDEVEAIQGAACTGWAAEGEGLPTVLQLVVDASSSMGKDAPGSDRSKWEETRDALALAIAELPPTVAVGVLYYPNTDVIESEEIKPVSACIGGDAMIPIAPLGGDGSPHRTLVEQSLQDAELNSWTPTHDAYKFALENGLLPYPGADRFMLLITDGAPTVGLGCVRKNPPTDPIVDEISGAYTEHGVRTFLIGSPGSEDGHGGEDMRPWLSEAAYLGGTAPDGCEIEGPNFCHMDMTEEPDFAAALRAGLSSVVGQIIDSCTFAVPTPPDGQTIDPDLTNVIVSWDDGSSTLFLPDADRVCTEGWFFDVDGNVELCPASCDRVKLGQKAQVQLHFGCGRDVIPVR